MAAKRCPFCGKKVDKKGYCQNTSCIDYERTKMHEEQDKEKKDEEPKNWCFLTAFLSFIKYTKKTETLISLCLFNDGTRTHLQIPYYDFLNILYMYQDDIIY